MVDDKPLKPFSKEWIEAVEKHDAEYDKKHGPAPKVAPPKPKDKK
jgi:hypothetical protein